MQTGYTNCPNPKCKKRIHIKEVHYTSTDIAHDIGCPYCDQKLGEVPRGRLDYYVSKAEQTK